MFLLNKMRCQGTQAPLLSALGRTYYFTWEYLAPQP